jgi:hypothetical protein
MALSAALAVVALPVSLVLAGLVPTANGAPAPGELVLNVAEFGAVADGVTDCTEAIRAAITRAKQHDGPSRIRFGRGDFRVKGTESGSFLGDAAITLEGCHSLTLEGEGERTVITVTDPRVGAIKVLRCQGVTVSGFAIDYHPVPFVQGTVVAADLAGGTYDVKLDPGYDFLEASWMTAAEGRFGMSVVQGSRDAARYGPIALFSDYSRQPGDLWRFRARDTGPLRLWGIAPGARFAYKASRYTQSAFMAVSSSDVTLADYTVHAAPALATLWAFNDGTTIRGLVVKPSPGRLMSSNADGIHAFGNRGQTLVEDCHFEGMGDDAINLHCRAGVVFRVESDTTIHIRAGAFECREGDLLQILDPVKGVVRAEATARAVRESDGVYSVELARPVAGVVAGTTHQEADNVYNLSACSAGFVIHRNYFGQHRGRAILLRSVGGTISDNVFENTQGNGVVITREGDWPEGPLSREISIRDNVFNGVGLGWAPCITVSAEKTGKQLAEGRDTRGITIEGNAFSHIRNSAVSVEAASHVLIARNRVVGADGDKLGRKSPVIALDHCDGVVIDDLRVEDPDPSTVAVVQIGASVDGGDPGVTIRGLQAKVGAATQVVVDRRAPR